jgi:aryl-alcohol dehydrogenase-like predicted oxidoreductase
MQQRRLGDATVGAIGLGAMPMSFQVRPERAQSISTIHAALDEGVTLIDTADAYTPDDRPPGHNEELVAEALAAYGRGADDVMVATKGATPAAAPSGTSTVARTTCGRRARRRCAACGSRR